MAPAGGKESAPLPKISFRKVEDGDTTQPMGVHDGSSRNYGYNNFKPFEKPDHYIRHIEPLEAELASQVEYDMDEQDQEWLDAMNRDRKKEQVDQVNYEIFEVIMDRLEKEWFDLMKLMPKPDMALPSEDTSCSICDDGEAENSNAILFCDGCNLAVHQDCYGVPYIPEGQWLCRKCTVSPDAPVSCLLCPNEGGAFKQTNKGQWAHLLCSIWIPEVTVGNSHIMEPIESVENIPKSRWKLICSICKERQGACIQCDVKTCFTAFHVTCARKLKLLMAMKNLPGQEETPLRAFCEKHLPKQLKELREAEAETGSPQPSTTNDSVQHRQGSTPPPASPTQDTGAAVKAARAYSSKFSAVGGPPLVPQIIIERIMTYIHKTRILKKPVFVLSVAKYWSLKRESRRGAPLLKRLHLEPWTASSLNRQNTDEEKAKKLDHLIRLRKDLEKVRMLTELTRKREKEKMRSAQTIQSFIEDFLFPLQKPLSDIFVDVINLDRNGVFRHLVSPNEFPDYYEVIKHPLTWTNMQDKLENHEYLDVQQFKDDVNLVLDNGMLYNQPSSSIHRMASKMKVSVQPILAKLDKYMVQPPVAVKEDAEEPGPKTEDDDMQTDAIGEPDDTSSIPAQPSLVGDLEPPLHTLDLLLRSSAIADHLDFFLPSNVDPLTSLMSYDDARMKPLPPAPTPPPEPTPPPVLEEVPPSEPADAEETIEPSEPVDAPKEEEQAVEEIMPEASGSGSVPPQPVPDAEIIRAVETLDLASGVKARSRKKRVKHPTQPVLAPPSPPPPEPEPEPTAEVEPDAVVEEENDFEPEDHDTPVVPLVQPARPPKPKRKHRKKVPPPVQVEVEERDEPEPEDHDEQEPVLRRPVTEEQEMEQEEPVVEDPVVVEAPEPEEPAPETARPDEPDVPAEQPTPTAPEKSQVPSEEPQPQPEPEPEPAPPPRRKSKNPKRDRERELKRELKRKREEEAAQAEAEAASEGSQRRTVSPVVASPSPTRSEEPPRKRKRVEAPEIPLTPPLVDDVGNKDSFLLFNQGWVLPQGTRRGGRERPVLPPLPVRIRHRPSKLSVAATSPADNETLQESVPAASVTSEAPADDAMDVEESERGQKQERSQAPEEGPEPEQEPKQEPSAEQAASSRPDEEMEAETVPTEPQPKTPPRHSSSAPARSSVLDDDDSDLSELSNLSETEERKTAKDAKKGRRKSRASRSHKKVKVPPPSAVTDEAASVAESSQAPQTEASQPASEKVWEGGTLVWAKSSTFPFFPAVVFEEDDGEIPQSVLDDKSVYENMYKNDLPLTLVRFYDNTSSWGWIPPKRLKMLGEDPDVDNWMMSNQKFKSGNIRTSCKKAYAEAMSEMESPEDLLMNKNSK